MPLGQARARPPLATPAQKIPRQRHAVLPGETSQQATSTPTRSSLTRRPRIPRCRRKWRASPSRKTGYAPFCIFFSFNNTLCSRIIRMPTQPRSASYQPATTTETALHDRKARFARRPDPARRTLSPAVVFRERKICNKPLQIFGMRVFSLKV